MGVQAEQLADIDTLVMDTYQAGTYTLLTTELQDYPAMRRLFKDKARTERGGEYLSFTAMVASNESAQTTSLFAELDLAQADLFKTGRVPWRHVTNYYLLDEREPILNSGSSDMADIIAGRRTDCLIDLAAKFEGWFWEAPTGSESADNSPPYGVEYWCPRVNTDTDGAFQGGDPSGFSAGCAGLAAADYPAWQNWSVGYSAVTEDDFVDRLDLASYKTNFLNPVAVPGSERSKYGYYTNQRVSRALQKMAKAQNDNLGYDLQTRMAIFGGTTIERVPYLDADTADPFYGIDWSVFRPTFLRGEWMNETIQIHPGKQHRVVAHFIDCSLNIECKNRRKLFVLYKV
jgi:hypothetical protein